MSLRQWFRVGSRAAFLAAGLALAAAPVRADGWHRAVQSGSVAYLPVHSSTPRIERYDLAAQAWLAPILVPETPNVVAVTPAALYVQSDTQLRRISHAGDVVWSVPNAANYLVADPAGRLFTSGFPTQSLRTFDSADGELLDEIDLGAAVGPTTAEGLSIAPGRRRLFFTLDVAGRTRVGAVDYDPAGALGPLVYSEPTDSSFNTFVFPGEDLVAEGEGRVLDAGTLEWRNSFFGPVDRLVFDGSTPIRVGWGISRYTTELELVGERFPFDVEAAFVHDGTFFEFSEHFFWPPDPPATVAAMPVGSIAFPPLPTPYPQPPPSPGTPRALGIDVHGTISVQHGGSPGPTLYRFSIPDGDFTAPVALRLPMDAQADCPLLGGMLFGRGTGELRVLSYDGQQNVHWRNVRAGPKALACTDEYVVVVTAGGVATYAPDGTDADSIEAPGPWAYYDAFATWSPERERLFVWMDGSWNEDQFTSYSIGDDGTIEPVSQAPISQLFAGPGPTFAADGPILVSGAHLYDPETLVRGERIGDYSALGAAWLGGHLYTLVRNSFEYEIVERNASGQKTRTARVGNAFALYRWGDALRVVFSDNGALSVRTVPVDDLDADGHADAADAFPNDPDEWNDRDADGVGDNADVYPDDASESEDSDGDGVGNNADPFPYNEHEWSDRDGDTFGDNHDAFPDDGSEWYDTDGDGTGDNADWAWQDPTEWADTDGDGVGDNADEFPLDPIDWQDADADGIGDHADPFPIGEPELGLVGLVGKERASFARIGAVSRKLLPSTLGLLPNGAFSLCDAGGMCVLGAHRAADARGRRFELDVDPDFIAAIQPELESALEDALGGAFRNRVWLDLLLRPQDSSAVVKLDRSGKHGTVKVKWVFDAFLGNVPRPYQYTRFTLTWKLRGADVVRP